MVLWGKKCVHISQPLGIHTPDVTEMAVVLLNVQYLKRSKGKKGLLLAKL